MQARTPLLNFWNGLGHIASHATVTVLAVGIAFSLPGAARYILFNWWPKAMENSRELLFTEIGLAAALVLLLNLVKLTWDYRSRARMSAIASLVFAKENDDWFSRWAKEQRLRRLPWKRDLTIMAVTGYGTFAAEDSALLHILQECYEIRVMLLNPEAAGAVAYAAAHAEPAATRADLRREVAASIACLRQLQGAGKKVTLKFYDDPPFWKLVFTGEYAWVRCCHGSRDAGKYPEYVFALQPARPSRGFFPAFYTYFLNRWNNPIHPEYAFDTDELVYRDAQGAELRREPYWGAHAEEVAVRLEPAPV
jgi:hypothetical protein